MSLIEVLVGALLTFLLFYLLFALLVPALKVSARSRVRAELRQSASVVMHQLQKLAYQSCPEGFSWRRDTPVAVAFNLVDQLQNDATLVWRQDFEVIWWDESEQLLCQRLWPPAPPAPPANLLTPVKPKRLDEALLASVVAAPSQKILARGVSEFKVEHDGGPGELRQPVVFSLTLEERSAEGLEKVQIRSSIALVNQR